MDCGNYRGINLMDSKSKANGNCEERGLYSVDLCKEGGTVNVIFTMTQIQGKIMKGNKKLYCTFMDVE